ncbi:hypothetical protein JJB11_21885 [Ramlibacter ginsenosidimutans]|uniref:Uncharacterized protein n=1 Tax=Ramlibacter ginsenosidimutans TaxID=502333 RepID=A0A934TWJ2_9BURK|nr:hypothetical protein [Ramlibacter ginsenosidimutans]MBK6008758.1 hypothetical protein [Ramlibacter ginsenosidimutans]
MSLESFHHVLQAQIAAYAALVNALRKEDSIDVKALSARLGGYAELLQPLRPTAAHMLNAYSAAVSGEAPDLAAILETLN